MTLTDSIERTLTLNATPDTVWPALATKEGVCRWFCDSIDGDWSPGQTVKLKWGDFGVTAKVQDVDPKTLVSYRWVPGSPDDSLPFSDDYTTLVEFRLSPSDGGSVLRVTESGFSRLPKEHWERCLSDNSQGWDEELAKLVGLFV